MNEVVVGVTVGLVLACGLWKLGEIVGWVLSVRKRTMPQRFERLASYNAEVSRGIPHTPEWYAEMAALQTDFDAWASR